MASNRNNSKETTMPTMKTAGPKTIAKHAPGPWAFTEGDRERRSCSDVTKASDKEFLIAYVLCDWRNELARADDIANARLIAAAPELLAACRFVAKYAAMRESKGDPLPTALTNAVSKALHKVNA